MGFKKNASCSGILETPVIIHQRQFVGTTEINRNRKCHDRKPFPEDENREDKNSRNCIEWGVHCAIEESREGKSVKGRKERGV